MKKLLALIVIGGMVGFISCGPSQKDKDAAKKKTQDSLDSIAKDKRVSDSLAQIRIADSTRKADSLAEIAKKKPQGTGVKPKTTLEDKKEKVKAGRG